MTEGRRLLEEGRQTNAVTTAPLTDDDGVLVSSTGATVATSPLTDSAGVMLSGDGSPVQSQMVCLSGAPPTPLAFFKLDGLTAQCSSRLLSILVGLCGSKGPDIAVRGQ